MIQVQPMGKEDERDYRSFIENSSGAVLYHTLEWRDIIARTYKVVPQYLIARENGDICGVLPLCDVKTLLKGRRLISLPFTQSFKVLAENDGVLQAFLFYLKDRVRLSKCKYAELRADIPLEKGWADDPAFQSVVRNYNTSLDLDKSIDEIWKHFKGNIRTAVRQAQKRGVIIKEGTSLGDYKTFYGLQAQTRKRQGLPIFPFTYYRLLFETLSSKGKCRLYLAYSGDIPIASVIIYEHNHYAIYGHSVSSANREYLRYRPVNLLLWEAIKQAHGRGNKVFDFGMTPLMNEGLLQFKSQWGALTKELSFCYVTSGRELHSKDLPYSLVVNGDGATGFKPSRKKLLTRFIMRNMPISISKALGPFILRVSN